MAKKNEEKVINIEPLKQTVIKAELIGDTDLILNKK